MKCEICNNNLASIHIQEIVGGQQKSLHICPECAAKKSLDNPVLSEINLAEMLYNLSEKIIGGKEKKFGGKDEGGEQPQVDVACPGCGWDSGKLRKAGRLGCPKCYEAFKELLSVAFKNMHRGAMHVGKKPGAGQVGANDHSAKTMLEIMELQKDLENCVQREEYEKAALLRDRIGELRGGAAEKEA